MAASTHGGPGPGAYERLLAASAGSLAVSVAVTPLDVVKVQAQAAHRVGAVPARLLACASSDGSGSSRRPLGVSSPHLAATSSLSPRPTLLNIFRSEGLAGIYAGLPVSLVLGVPSATLYLLTYETARDRLQAADCLGQLREAAPVLAGGFGRFVSCSVCAPLEVLRVRVQAAGETRATATQACQRLLAQEGCAGFFRGLTPTLLSQVPFSAFYFGVVEACRCGMTRRGWWEDSKFQAPLQALLAGMVAGSAGAVVTMPLDNVKTRWQLETSNPGQKPCDAGIWRALVRIYKHEGASALMTGTRARVARAAVSCAVMLGSYESVKLCWRAA